MLRGRLWLVLGVLIGIALGIGKVPYLAGAASSLADTAQRVVGTLGLTLIHDAADHGASQRVVLGSEAFLAALVPGITALGLVVAARSTLVLRRVLAVLLVALGVGAYFYLPHGPATGVALLAIAVAGIAVVATGPLVVAPLAAVAALIGTTFLPRLVASDSKLPTLPVNALHVALFESPGSPLWLQIVVLVIAAVPFAFAARLVIR